MSFTDSELRELRQAIDATKREAHEKDQAAKTVLREMREEGVNPVMDQDAYDKYSAVAKEADGLKDRVAELRERYENALENRGNRRDVRTREEPADRPASLGLRLTQDEQYERFLTALDRDLESAVKAWRPVEVATRDEARSILQRDVSSDALVTPDRQSGIIEHAYRRVRALDLISVLNTDSDTVEYVEESAPTENVDDVPYGGTPGTTNPLPESTYGFVERTVSTSRLGHHVPATEKQLADAGQLSGLLDTRLRSGVRRKVEGLVVAGDTAGGDAFDGILTNANIGTVTRDTTNGETRHDVVYRAITTVRVATEGELDPTAIGIHPNDMQTIVLEKDSSGNYLNARGATEIRSLWGLTPVVSTVFPQGNPLIGAYEGANLWLRTGIAVAMNEAHSDWFLKGWIAVKAQVRAAFGVTLPRNFCEVMSF